MCVWGGVESVRVFDRTPQALFHPAVCDKLDKTSWPCEVEIPSPPASHETNGIIYVKRVMCMCVCVVVCLYVCFWFPYTCGDISQDLTERED